MVIKKLAFCMALCSLSSISAAQDTQDSESRDASRLYLGVGLGLSKLEPNTTGTIYKVEDDSSEGGKLYLGYDISEKFTVEAYYSILGEAEMSPTGSVEYEDLGINANYFFYGASSGQPGLGLFARVGVGQMKNSTELPYGRNNDTHLMLGGGIQYGFKNGWALRADIDLYDGDSKLLAFGINKHFGPGKDEHQPKPIAKPEPLPVEPVAAQSEPEATPTTFIPTNPDEDGDGVVNSKDNCPNTQANTSVDQNGCELPKIISLEGVRFASASDELVGESTDILDSVAERLAAYSSVKIEVAGHTDSQGSADFNRKLSERRANAVREYLIEKGVPEDTLTAKGYGESRPVADNSTPQGRAANRRVELELDHGGVDTP